MCGFCAVRLACVVCLKEMAFNRGTKKKKRGQVCFNFKTDGNKSVLRALSKEMDLEYKSTNYNIFMQCSCCSPHNKQECIRTLNIDLCINCLSPHNSPVNIQYIFA